MTTATSSAQIYVIFVPKSDNAFHSFSVPRTTSFADIEQRIAQAASDAGRVNVRNGDTAYAVFDGAKTRNVEHAMHMASAKGLCFIPPELVLALKERYPSKNMRGVREEFKRRHDAYIAVTQKPNSGANPRAGKGRSFEEMMSDFGMSGVGGFDDIFAPRPRR